MPQLPSCQSWVAAWPSGTAQPEDNRVLAFPQRPPTADSSLATLNLRLRLHAEGAKGASCSPSRSSSETPGRLPAGAPHAQWHTVPHCSPSQTCSLVPGASPHRPMGILLAGPCGPTCIPTCSLRPGGRIGSLWRTGTRAVGTVQVPVSDAPRRWSDCTIPRLADADSGGSCRLPPPLPSSKCSHIVDSAWGPPLCFGPLWFCLSSGRFFLLV